MWWIESDPPIAHPGDRLTLAASSTLSGELVLSGPGGILTRTEIVDGEATVDVPNDAPDGEYLVTLAEEAIGTAVGLVHITSGSALRLVADRQFVGPADDVAVTLDALDVSDDAVVLFGWGDLDFAAYLEDEDDGEIEPLGFLIPDEEGLLHIGYDPVPLRDVVGRSLLLSGMQVAGLQAVVIDPESEEVSHSNHLRLAGCADASRLSGTIGGPGAVRILATGAGVRSAGLATGDGSFVLDTPHGPLAVFGVRDDGTQVEPLVVDVPCGAEVFLDLARGEAEVIAPEASVPDENFGFVAGESGSLAFTGDLEIEFPVEPVCDYQGSEVKVTFATYDSDVPAVLLYVDGGEAPGSYTGTLEITDWSAGAAQSQGPAEITITYAADALLARGMFEVDARYAGAAGDGSVTGAFTCTVLGLLPPEGSEPTGEAAEDVFDLFAVAPVTPLETLSSDAAVGATACRNLLIDDRHDPATGTRLAATLREHLPRAAVVTRSELDWLLSAEPGGYLGPGRASEVAFSVADGAPDLVVTPSVEGDVITLDIAPVVRPAYFHDTLLKDENLTAEQDYARDRSGPWSISAPLTDLPAALAEGVLCVDMEDVWAVPGEAAELTVAVTDLAGRPADGVAVEIDAGKLATVDPGAGTTTGGRFEASLVTSESGSASVAANVGGEQWRPTATTARLWSAPAYSMEGQYRVVLNPDPDAPIAPGPMSVTLVARSCIGIVGGWRGAMYLEAGPYLSLLQTAGGMLSLFGGTQDPGVAAFSVLGDAGYAEDVELPSLVDLPYLTAFRFISIQAIDPTQAIPVPVDFSLPPAGGRVWMAVGGERPSEFTGRHVGRRSLMHLSVNGVHLLTARIRPANACDPFELDRDYAEFRDAFVEWTWELAMAEEEQ